eukprot:TRINITY_DN20403_c0_g2_i1.p1 TRINITY_DN20403_c0_g2~~TRINITY_DN20403_c0_g2_i1.p1  ORF type:complete len:474 (+),score=82.59 TRINITY_DN20403_c0_g2_i1:23-1423(+)
MSELPKSASPAAAKAPSSNRLLLPTPGASLKGSSSPGGSPRTRESLNARLQALQEKTAGSSPSSRAAGSFSKIRGSLFAFRSVTGGASPSFFTEKQAVVIDFGRAYTKVGFAGESRPRHLFPSPELRARRQLSKEVSASLSYEAWVEVLEELLRKVFFQYLSVSPKDRRVVVCDEAYSASSFRAALCHVLFKCLTVPAVSFVLELVLPLYLTGLGSGIVIDCGYESARVLPTYAGVPVLSAYSEAACGFRHVQAALREAALANLPASATAELRRVLTEDAEEALEEFIVRACYVTCDFPQDGDLPACTFRSEKPAALTLPGQPDAIAVSPECRWEPLERFFDSSLAGEEGGSLSLSIPEAFVHSLESCSRDVRAAVVQNVVVCGGCAGLRGLLPRLAIELQGAMQDHPEMAPLASRLLFTPLDFAPVCAAWTGGAVFASLEGSTDYTAEDYEKGAPLPDWLRDGFI